MKLKKDNSFKKERGGYYTPEKLSNFIINELLEDNKTVLEPSCGDGVFLNSIINSKATIKHLDAVEIVKEEFEKCMLYSKKNNNINLINDDFYNFYQKTKTKYDIIIGNPPYIRYQYLSEKQRIKQAKVLLENQMTPNKLINSWVFFLVACIDMLNENGKIGFVIPAELLQVVYAEDLWRLGGATGDRTGHRHRLCLRLFADAGILPGAVCGGQRRQLLQGICQSAPDLPFPPCFTAGAGRGGGSLLFPATERCMRIKNQSYYVIGIICIK
jgi:hypothetical protein